MKKGLWKKFLLVSTSFFVFMVGAAQQKPWTFLVYIAAANDLHANALLDLQQMMQVGSNEKVNILVYLTLHEDGQPKVTKKLYVERGTVEQIGPSMRRDSGEMTTLEEALQWACADYPSDRIAVMLWSYGSGALNRSQQMMSSKGVCYDFDTEHYLTDRDCLDAFSWVQDHLRGGKKFDIIAFHASFLASLEIAYTLSSCANYLVASEGAIVEGGYNYVSILDQLATQKCNALALARLMANTYKQDYIEPQEYTLSVIDLNALTPLVDNCNAVARILTMHLRGKNKDSAKMTLKKCINMNFCSCFDQKGIYVDLCQFYKNLLKYIDGLKLSKSIINQFKQLLEDGIKLFPAIIKANVTSTQYRQAGGITIYFSRYSCDPSYYGLYWTEQNPNWLNVLECYLA